ncbi:interferon-related developmental regulator 2 [Cylas formicarius]|uniref:interferon-related developmental regulator 2 n=1 Tax=Cylas formicarius TaxID=197179 RepID=UPI0029588149|nr:interferon-related developmental regulator 2 [Cylas formicarius]
MPKGKKKGKSDRSRVDGSLQTSDDDSFENASVMSNYSENHSVDENNDGADDYVPDQQHEDKLNDIVDGLMQKSSQGRTNCYTMLRNALIKKHAPAFVKDRLFTLCDCVEKSLKKGIAAEVTEAAELATVMAVQLGVDESADGVWQSLRPILLAIACDKAATPLVRAKCCATLGNIAFLTDVEVGEILTLMQQLEAIFAGSYLKGDGIAPNVTTEVAQLHAAALSSWSLLFTLMAPGNIATMMNNSKVLPTLEHLSELLESSHLELRLSAGEALVLVFELGREEDKDFAEDFALDIAETLRQLATDSHKYRAKKDRKQQRATFREVLQYIENDTASDVQIKIGRRVLPLNSWVKRKHYDTLCNILGPSINIHLLENDLLKDILEIEPVEESRILAHTQNQIDRAKRKVLNAANFKARTISRAKNRDKRSDF